MQIRYVILVIVGLLAAGCGREVKEDVTIDWNAERLYQEARTALLDKGYQAAIDYYQKIEARYPYGAYAEQAKLDIGYAYFKNNEPEVALDAVERFIRLYPLHPAVDYAHYLKGLINFRRNISIFEKLIPQDMSEREVETLQQAYDDFLVLLRLFPESKYAEDARQRMLYIRNTLAAHELHVARYYMRRGAYVAVVKRAQYVIDRYPGAPVTPEALNLLVRAYRVLEMDQLAADTLRILHHNYPDHEATLQAAEFSLD